MKIKIVHTNGDVGILKVQTPESFKNGFCYKFTKQKIIEFYVDGKRTDEMLNLADFKCIKSICIFDETTVDGQEVLKKIDRV